MNRYFFLIFLFLFLFSCNDEKECRELVDRLIKQPEIYRELVKDTVNTTKEIRSDRYSRQEFVDYFVNLLDKKFRNGYNIYLAEKTVFINSGKNTKTQGYEIHIKNLEEDLEVIFLFKFLEGKYKLWHVDWKEKGKSDFGM
jgi:hypothetical protein